MYNLDTNNSSSSHQFLAWFGTSAYQLTSFSTCTYAYGKRLVVTFIGVSLSEPHTGQTASPAIYVCLSHTSFRKSMPPCSNSLSSFDFALRPQFRKCHHVQIIETASILHVQCVLDDDDERVHVATIKRLTTRHSFITVLVIVHWVGQLKLPWTKLLDNWFYRYLYSPHILIHPGLMHPCHLSAFYESGITVAGHWTYSSFLLSMYVYYVN